MAALVGVQFAFATWAIVGKVTLRAVSPLALVSMRLAGGALVFAVLAALRGRPVLPPREALREITGLALLGLIANQLLFTYGLRLTTAINAAVLGALIPLFTVVYAAASGRERAGARVWTGVAVAMTGTLLITRVSSLSFADRALAGNAMITVNGVFYAAYLVRARDAIARYGAERVVGWIFVVAAVILAPIGLPAVVTHAGAWNAHHWAAIAYVVLMPTAFAYGANAWALQRAPSSLVAVFIYLQPAMAMILAITVGDPLARWLGVVEPHEVLTLRTLVGSAAVLAGVWIASRRK